MSARHQNHRLQHHFPTMSKSSPAASAKRKIFRLQINPMESPMASQPRATNVVARQILGCQLASLAAFMLLLTAGARAQQTKAASLGVVNQGTQVAQAGAPPSANPEAGGGHTLHLLVGRSLVITSPTPIKRVSVADPNIVEAVVVSPFQLLLNGKVPGGVSLLIWDETDQSQTFEVSVDIDILSLN